jgi:hypothetical protein
VSSHSHPQHQGQLQHWQSQRRIIYNTNLRQQVKYANIFVVPYRGCETIVGKMLRYSDTLGTSRRATPVRGGHLTTFPYIYSLLQRRIVYIFIINTYISGLYLYVVTMRQLIQYLFPRRVQWPIEIRSILPFYRQPCVWMLMRILA